MKIAIIVAMDSEYAMLRTLLGEKDRGHLGVNEIILSRCGIGKVNAAVRATELILTERPDCIISSGVAGGISSDLKPMDVVVADQITYHDVWCGEGNAYGQVQGLPERFLTDRKLLAAAHVLEHDGLSIHSGLVASGDYFITTMREAGRIRSYFPRVLAVDMESGALAQTCHLLGVPFISFRIISDASGEDHQSAYDHFWEHVGVNSFRIIREYIQSLPASLS